MNVTLPILTVKLWDTAPMIDLIICKRLPDGRPLDAPSKTALQGFLATTCLQDELHKACSLRTIDQVYAEALQIVKLWAFRRGIYGSGTGYLNGVAWSALLAYTMIQGIQDKTLRLSESSEETTTNAHCAVTHFFEASSRWSLPLSVNLTDKEQVDANNSRPIQILAFPESDNLARSITLPAALAIFGEFARSASLLASANLSLHARLAAILDKYSLAEFLSSFETILLIQLSMPNVKTPDFAVADKKAWACRQILNLTIKLEHVVDSPLQIRPRPTPVRVAKRSFVWLIGLQASVSRQLHEYVEEKAAMIQQDWASSFPLASSDETNIPSVELKSSTDLLEHWTRLGVNVATQ